MNPVLFSELTSLTQKVNTDFVAAAPKQNGLDENSWKQVNQITSSANAIFQKYNASKQMSCQANVDFLQKLRNQLEQVKSSLTRSKSLSQYFCSFFRYLSRDEEVLHQTLSQIKKAEEAAKTAEASLWNLPSYFGQLFGRLFGSAKPIVESVVVRQTNSQLASAKGKLSEGYFRVMGKEAFPSSLEGSSSRISLASIRTDLIEFSNTHVTLFGKDFQDLLSRTVHKMAFAEKIATEIDVAYNLMHYTDPVLQSDSTNKLRMADISYQIQTQLAQLGPNEELVLPGGYSNVEKINGVDVKTGHAIIFSIRRQLNGNFSFTIVNTGLGAERFSGVGSLLKSVFWDGHYTDKVIKDIDPKKMMDTSFLVQLMEQVLPTKNHSMDAVFNLILKHLADGKADKIEEGRRHTVQANGTCTHDSIMSWLEDALPEELFHSFNVYATGTGLHRIHHVRQHQATDYDVTYITGNWRGSEYRGLNLMDKIAEIGKNTLDERKKRLQELVGATQAEFNLAVKVEKKRQRLRETLVNRLDEKSIKRAISAKKIEVNDLAVKVKDEAQKKEKETQKSSLFGRVLGVVIDKIGPSSELARQFKEAQDQLKILEEHRIKLEDPAFQADLRRQIDEVDAEIRANKEKQTTLSKKKSYLESFLRHHKPALTA